MWATRRPDLCRRCREDLLYSFKKTSGGKSYSCLTRRNLERLDNSTMTRPSQVRWRATPVKNELVSKSREAALTAVQVFNNPLVRFKSETFIVLMTIAWTYLLHAYYRSNKIEYRYYTQGPKRRKFDRTRRGAFKYWELERCLNATECPIDHDTANNLRFLIGLRHEIEHQMTRRLDNYLSGRYQACALNYNYYLKKLFGPEQGIEQHMLYSLQFGELTPSDDRSKEAEDIPVRVRSYIADFDQGLTEGEYRSERYSFRLLFTKKLANRVNQADKVVEFVDPKSELGQSLEKEYWVTKETERPKYLPSQVVSEMEKAGYRFFGMQHHTDLWKRERAKDPSRGWGVMVGKTWYWYGRWVDHVREYCENNRSRFT